MLTFRLGSAPSRVELPDTGGCVVHVNSPLLRGVPEERHPFPMGEPVAEGDWLWFETGATLCGVAVVDASGEALEPVSRRLYEAMLRRTRGRHLYRVWHHVPHINREVGGLETYRRFCRARAEAFEACFPSDFERRMCAASAVGVDGDRLIIVVLAGDAVPEHFENPAQTPAYRYPAVYGPKPPSFARATRVRLGADEWIWISGTAAITGSESRHDGDFAAQASLLAENLRRVGEVAGVTPTDPVRVRTYVKPAARRASAEVVVPGWRFAEETEVFADICRDELLLESEVTVFRAGAPA